MAELEDWILFNHGGCKDACIGTLLLHYGVSKPECMIFKDLRFVINGAMDGGYRPLELFHQEYTEEIARRTGIAFQFCHPKDFGVYVRQIKQCIAQAAPVIVTVDHYEYEHSQFYQSVHMPHYIIVAAQNSKDEYVYVDPYPLFDIKGTFDLATLRRLSDSPDLLEYRNGLFVPDVSQQRAFDPEVYLVETWRETARNNIRSMLGGGNGENKISGIGAIHRVALYVSEWMEQRCSCAQQRCDFPVDSSLLDVGSNRAGYSLYLHWVGELVGASVFLDLEKRYKEISSCWDTVSALRNLYQESKIRESWEIAPEFVERKLERVPSLIHLLADMEEEALNILRRFIDGGDVL